MLRRGPVLCLVVVALFACKRKQEATALDRDDGRGKTKDCPLVAGGVIAKDTTVQSGCLVNVGEPYTIKNGATLRIEAGARLSFKKGARIVVENGAIVANGTKSEPVVFTSGEKAAAAGDWGGLVFASSMTSSLTSVVVEYAGEEPKLPEKNAKAAALAAASSYGMIGLLGYSSVDDYSPLSDRRPAIFVAAESKLALVDSIVRHAPRVGLAADGDAPFERFEGNDFADNGGFAMDVPASALGGVTSIAGTEPVRVRGTVGTSQSWPKVPAGIVVASLRVVAAEKGSSVVLTLAPDSVVRVMPRASLRFGGYNEGGAVVAKKVMFTSAADKPAAGDWAGIVFEKRAPGTLIDGCTIEYAGWEPAPPSPAPTTKSKSKSPPRPKRSAITIQEWMKDFQIIHTTFRNNAGPGMGKSESYFAFSIGTGGCEGLDNPKNDNKSVGQPLCEYHEDPLKDLLGPGGLGDVPLNMLGSSKPHYDILGGPGDGVGLGTIGKGGGGGGLSTGGGAGGKAP